MLSPEAACGMGWSGRGEQLRIGALGVLAGLALKASAER